MVDAACTIDATPIPRAVKGSRDDDGSWDTRQFSVVATVVFLLAVSASLAMGCDRYRIAGKVYTLTFSWSKICLASAPVHSSRGSIAARGEDCSRDQLVEQSVRFDFDR